MTPAPTPPGGAIKSHELWRLNYRKHRDLDHLTAEELSERFHDCLNNFRTRTDNGKIGVLSVKEPLGRAWITLATEVMEECSLRGYAYPDPINLAPYRESVANILTPVPDVDRAIAGIKRGSHPLIFKFGEPKWLRPSFEHGRFRIASASYYDSAAHNHARRDTELVRYFRLNPLNPWQSFFKSTGPSKTGWSSVASPSDYLLFCLAAKYSSRLFGDFASSACIIFHDGQRFLTRLMSTLRRKYPDWHFSSRTIDYYDPVRDNPQEVVVPWTKPFKHAYQLEIRVVCAPPNPIARLDPIEVEIGSLADCAIYVDCDTHPPPVLPPDPKDGPVRLFGSPREGNSMTNELPDAAKMQGIMLHKEGERKNWYFTMQYTDATGAWHQVKVPVNEGLYLMKLLEMADKEQALTLFGQKNTRW